MKGFLSRFSFRFPALIILGGLLTGCAVDYRIDSPANAPLPAEIQLPPMSIDRLEFLPDGQTLLAGGQILRDGQYLNRILLIDCPTRKILLELDGVYLARSGNLLVTWRAPNNLSVHENTGGSVKLLWTTSRSSAYNIRFLPGGKFLQLDDCVRDTGTGATILELEPGAALTDDLAHYATFQTRPDDNGKTDLTIVLKNAKSRQAQWTRKIEAPLGFVPSRLEFDASGKALLIAGYYRLPLGEGLRASTAMPPPTHRAWVLDAGDGHSLPYGELLFAHFTADRKALLASVPDEREDIRLLGLPGEGRGGEELARFGKSNIVSSASGLIAGPAVDAAGPVPVNERIQCVSSNERLAGRPRLPAGYWDCDTISEDGKYLLLRSGDLPRCVIDTSSNAYILQFQGETGGGRKSYNFGRRAALCSDPALLALHGYGTILLFDLRQGATTAGQNAR